jgi:hypothetical protein
MCISDELNVVTLTLLTSTLTNERGENHGTYACPLRHDSALRQLPWHEEVIRHNLE